MRDRHHAAALSLLCIGMLLGGCGNGNGGDDAPSQHFVGTVNFGPCDFVTVWIDLEVGRAKVSHRSNGMVDCTPSPLLEARGCTVMFAELDSGRQLVTTIDGCAVPEDSVDLFSCVFDKIDVERLEAATVSSCSCADEPLCFLNGSTCRREPTLCIGKGEEPGACEDCGNGRDDNGDGLVDCSDPDCSWSNYCGAFGPNNSTVTCSSSTSTITVVTSTLPSAFN